VDLVDAKTIGGWHHAAAVRSIPVRAARHKITTMEEEEEEEEEGGGGG